MEIADDICLTWLENVLVFKNVVWQILLYMTHPSVPFQNTNTEPWACETHSVLLILTLKLILRELQSSNKNRALWAVDFSSINPHNVNHEVSTPHRANKPELYYITPQQGPAIFNSFIELDAVRV